METVISSTAREVVIGGERPTVIIGERINPAGKKKMAEALKAGNLDIIRREAEDQVKAGADVIDVNVATFGIDEAKTLPEAIRAVTDTVGVPLCIDSPRPEALAAALKVYRGKPIVNSVSGEARSLEQVLPLVKEYGAAVIGLTQDEAGIPGDALKRLEIAVRIVERAERLGIPRSDVIIDCLALAVGAYPGSGLVVFETIRLVKEKLGVNITLGASNISFGLPDRNLLNGSFLAMAIAAGVTCPVADAARVRPVVLAADLLLGRDKYARRYIADFRNRQSQG